MYAYNSGLPNVPGMLTHKDSWVYRKIDGFKKSNKPQDSTMLSGRFAATSLFDVRTTSQRPVSASHVMDHSLNLISDLERQQRIHLQESSSGYLLPTTGLTGNYFRNRPQSAPSAPVRTTSSDRTGGLRFQDTSRAPPVSRNIPNVASFVETERLVARFYGNFSFDRVLDPGSLLGPASVDPADSRQVTIVFFIEDQTCEITEKKQLNSGITGGLFFARGKTRKSNGDPLEIRDLAPGNTVCILGRQIHICDADKFTRDYFRRVLRLALPPAIRGPDAIRPDQSAQQATGLGFQRGSAMSKTSFGVRSTDYLNSREEYEKSQRFLKCDTRTLRFTCIDAPGSKQSAAAADASVQTNEQTGEYELNVPETTKKFVLEYFMSDSSIELRIQKGVNNLNLDNWLLLKKSRLPRNWQAVQRGVAPIYFNPSDLRVGSVVDIYSRRFLLVECDQVSQEFYCYEGDPQDTIRLVTVEEHVVHEIPRQGDGFLPIGGAEDTLGTVYGQPHPSKMEKRKSPMGQDLQLRCRVKMITRNNIDGTRPLQLVYFLSDDSIQIYEEIVRNSGIGGGNYLKRGRYVNSLPPSGEEPRRFKPTDIFLGNVFCVNGQEMQIVYMDSSTLQYCEANSSEYPLSDTFKIMYGMAEQIDSMGLDVRRSFGDIDIYREGYLGEASFVAALDSWGMTAQLNDQELISVLRRFQASPTTASSSSSSSSNRYMYDEMCDLFSHILFSREGQRQRVRGGGGTVDDLSELMTTLRSQTTQWRRAFRKDESSSGGFIPLSRLAAILAAHSVLLSAEAKQQISEYFSASPPLGRSNISLQVHQQDRNNNSNNLPLPGRRKINVDASSSKVNRSTLPKGCNLGLTKRLLASSNGSNSAPLSLSLSGQRLHTQPQHQSRLSRSLSLAQSFSFENTGAMLQDSAEYEHEQGQGQGKAGFGHRTALQEAIASRRGKLMTSVIRNDNRDEQRAHGEMKLSEGSCMDRDSDMHPKDTSSLINYELFCNDIYVCDWA